MAEVKLFYHRKQMFALTSETTSHAHKPDLKPLIFLSVKLAHVGLNNSVSVDICMCASFWILN